MIVFDKNAQKMRRRRAVKTAHEFDFLLRHASQDIADRVSITLRQFDRICVLGAAHGVTALMLSACENVGTIVEADVEITAFSSAREGTAKLPETLKIVCDDELLPLAPGTFDLIVAPLNLHLVNDLPGTLVQIRKALKPDGLFLGVLLGGQTLRELRESLMVAEEELSGGVSPRVFPVAEVRDFGGLLQRAGFALPVVDSETLDISYETPFGLLKDLRGMGATNALADRLRRPPPRAMFARMGQIYADRFSLDNGRVSATFEMITLTGWAPHESQQKPLRPGSAKVRLADALDTREHSAGETASPNSKEAKAKSEGDA